MTSYVPLHDYVLVKPIEKTAKSAGGIHLPDTVDVETPRVTVVAVGSGAYSENGTLIPMTVKIGHTVIIGPAIIGKIKDGSDMLFIMKESNVLVIV